MNERIKELLKQASKLANTDDNKDIDRNFDMIVAEKFAELIVRECADFIDAHKRVDEYGLACDIVYGEDLMKHLGFGK
jgi:hypothetical protein